MENALRQKKVPLNARVSAVCILLGSVLLHVLNQTNTGLVPLRLVTLLILVMGAWAFSDEMGLRKPLNRAGFVVFMMSIVALGVTVLEPSMNNVGKYYLLYSFALLFSMLIWSMAFMHRKRDVQVMGKIGVLAAVVPIAALIVGHVSVAAGAYIGVDSLLSMTGGADILNSIPVKAIEATFILWALATAIMLWKGKLSQHQG